MFKKLLTSSKRVVAALALGVGLAQGLLLFTVEPAVASSEDGSCVPLREWVCGMNGQNFEDKYFMKGNP